jgi:hypothetical protein
VYTQSEAGVISPWFNLGENTNFGMTHEFKGTGSYRYKIEVRNSAGDLLYKIKSGTPDVDTPTFETGNTTEGLPPPEAAGWYTIKIVYVDNKTGNTWSRQTKIHVSAPLN